MLLALQGCTWRTTLLVVLLCGATSPPPHWVTPAKTTGWPGCCLPVRRGAKSRCLGAALLHEMRNRLEEGGGKKSRDQQVRQANDDRNCPVGQVSSVAWRSANHQHEYTGVSHTTPRSLERLYVFVWSWCYVQYLVYWCVLAYPPSPPTPDSCKVSAACMYACLYVCTHTRTDAHMRAAKFLVATLFAHTAKSAATPLGPLSPRKGWENMW